MADGNGTLAGTTSYHVNPKVEVDLTEKAKAITKTPNTGYTAEGGSWDKELKQTFGEDTEIKFIFKALDDVIPKTNDNQEKPDGYVTVTLIPTDKATDTTNKVYFVNPTKEVTIKNKPEGIKETISGIEYTYDFKGWTVTTGTIDSWNDENIKGTFIQDTEITAQYKALVNPGELIAAPIGKKNVITPVNVTPDAKDLIENIFDSNNTESRDNLPENTTFEYAENGEPDVSKAGKTTASVKVTYPNGKTVVVKVPVTVVDNVVPQTGNDKPNVPDNYVKVTFVIAPAEGGKIVDKEVTTYYVNPEKDVTVPQPKTQAETGYVFEKWDQDTTTAKKYTENTTVKGNFKKLEDIIPGKNNEKPEGYVKVTFLTNENGTLTGETVYYVNPKAGKTIKDITLPTINPKDDYKKGTPEWSPNLDNDNTEITADRMYVANYEAKVKYPSEFKICYVSGNPEGGTVDKPSETVAVDINAPKDAGVIKGATATAKDGYKFVKWINTNGETVSTDLHFVPTERKEATYIAVFEKTNTVIVVPGPSNPTDEKDPNKPDGGRVGGKDRTDTAIEISKKYFGQANTVIVVDRKDFPDAMTASVLSKLLNAPILLTETNRLDPRVAAEIQRLGARDVIIVGGNSSVSEAVKKELAKFDKDEVERIYGRDRYETSAQVARRVVGITGKIGHGVVASGEVFADALTVAPFAAREGYPILLVKRNSVPPTINKAIKDLSITKVTIAGGYSTVAKSLESSLPTVVERLRGNSRYETAIDIVNKKFNNANEIFLANGEQWMDALVIGPVGGILDIPILLTGANNAPKSLKDYIAKSKIEKITAIGGRSMVSDKVLNELSK